MTCRRGAARRGDASDDACLYFARDRLSMRASSSRHVASRAYPPGHSPSPSRVCQNLFVAKELTAFSTACIATTWTRNCLTLHGVRRITIAIRNLAFPARVWPRNGLCSMIRAVSEWPGKSCCRIGVCCRVGTRGKRGFVEERRSACSRRSPTRRSLLPSTAWSRRDRLWPVDRPCRWPLRALALEPRRAQDRGRRPRSGPI